jgi:hypothetical protein
MSDLPLALWPGWLPRGRVMRPWPTGKPPRDDPEKQRLIALAYQRVLEKHPVRDEVDEALVEAWASITICEEMPTIESDALEELVRCVKARARGKWFVYRTESRSICRARKSVPSIIPIMVPSPAIRVAALHKRTFEDFLAHFIKAFKASEGDSIMVGRRCPRRLAPFLPHALLAFG